jgi:hypothetical protein
VFFFWFRKQAREDGHYRYSPSGKKKKPSPEISRLVKKINEFPVGPASRRGGKSKLYSSSTFCPSLPSRPFCEKKYQHDLGWLVFAEKT